MIRNPSGFPEIRTHPAHRYSKTKPIPFGARKAKPNHIGKNEAKGVNPRGPPMGEKEAVTARR